MSTARASTDTAGLVPEPVSRSEHKIKMKTLLERTIYGDGPGGVSVIGSRSYACKEPGCSRMTRGVMGNDYCDDHARVLAGQRVEQVRNLILNRLERPDTPLRQRAHPRAKVTEQSLNRVLVWERKRSHRMRHEHSLACVEQSDSRYCSRCATDREHERQQAKRARKRA